MTKEYAYGKKSERIFYDKLGQRGKRISVLSCMEKITNKLLAPFYFEGFTNNEVFKTYLNKVYFKRIKELRKDNNNNFKDKEIIFILDNASFHKGKEIEELFKKNKVSLLYLPPYSPDLNPIEKKWSQLKTIYRKEYMRLKK